MRRRPLLLHLQVFPRIGVAGGDGREHVLPFLRYYLGADRVDERVTEHWHQVVVLEDPALDLLGELLALGRGDRARSEEHTSELQSQSNLVCRLLLEKKKKKTNY